MIDAFLSRAEFLLVLFAHAAWQAGVLVLIVLGLAWLLGHRLNPRWRFALWMVVFARLALPILPAAPWSLFGLLTSERAENSGANAALVADHHDAPETAGPLTTQSSVTAIPMDTVAALSPEFVDRRVPPPVESGPLPLSVAHSTPSTPAPADSPAPWAGIPWLRIASVLWMIGVVLLAARHIATSLRFRRERRGWQPVTESVTWTSLSETRRVSERRDHVRTHVQAALEDCRHQIRLRRTVHLFLSPGNVGPATCGILRPCIVLPKRLAESLSPAELRLVLLHELVHVRRLDVLWNRLATLISIVHWFHPVGWLARFLLRKDRELACDATVLDRSGEQAAAGYGHVILKTVETLITPSPLPGLVGMFSRRPRSFLERRIRMIAAHRPGTWRMPVIGAAALVVLALVGLTDRQERQRVLADEPIRSVADRDEAEKDDASLDKDLAPAKVADHIERTMQRFASVEYRATGREVHDTNSHFPERPPLLVEGPLRYAYRSDGRRWLVDEDRTSFTMSKTTTDPEHLESGFDGNVHFHTRHDTAYFGEDDLTSLRLAPRVVFWHAARTWEHLLHALRHSSARIDRREKIDGHECLVILAEPKSEYDKTDWRYEITISPTQSWLPLKTTLRRGPKPYAEETIKPAQTTEGVWHPDSIRFEQVERSLGTVRKELRITYLALRDKFRDEEFRYAAPFGHDIVDYRSDAAWCNDPWWSDLEPWLTKHVQSWRPSLEALKDLESFCDGAIAGKTAPEIRAERWINGNPGLWRREGRTTTIVFFFGGQAIDPTPKWIAGIKAVKERCRPYGIDMIGVATATKTPEAVEQTVRELGVKFPIAIDTADKGFGQTFTAFGLRNYAGAFVVDRQAKVHVVEAGKLESLAKTVALADGARPPPKEAPLRQPDISMEDWRRIDAEWKRRARAPGTATIHGEVLRSSAGRDRFGDVALPGETLAGIAAEVRIEPVMRLLMRPAAHAVFRDAQRQAKQSCDDAGQFSLKGLRKGAYTVTISAPGLARVKRVVHLAADDSKAELSLTLRQGGTIRGIVQDSDGQGVPLATIKATQRHFDAARPRYTTTADLPGQPERSKIDGRFEFTELYDGAYTLEVSAPGYETRAVELIPAGKQGVKITLRRK